MNKVVLTSVMAYSASAFGAEPMKGMSFHGTNNLDAPMMGTQQQVPMMAGASPQVPMMSEQQVPMMAGSPMRAREAPPGRAREAAPGSSSSNKPGSGSSGGRPNSGSSSNKPGTNTYGGGGPVNCPTGYNWANPGKYCISDDLYECNYEGYPAKLIQSCGYNGCHASPPGREDYCYGTNGGGGGSGRPDSGGGGGSGRPNSRPTPRPYYNPTPRPYYNPTPRPRPAGQTNCDYSNDCQSCLRTSSSDPCFWDPNWNKCRPERECDFTYKPPPTMGYSQSASDDPNMNVVCYKQLSQCFTGNDNQIENNQGSDKCTRVDNCYDCASEFGCVFDTGRNLCVSTLPGVPCFPPSCINNSYKNVCKSG